MTNETKASTLALPKWAEAAARNDALIVETLTNHPEWWGEKVAPRLQPDGSGCLIWTGGRTPGGYGRMTVGGGTFYVHRVAYLRARGSIPYGYTVDHLCGIKACASPKHLEAVPMRVNILRGGNAGAENARKSVCSSCGGAFTGVPGSRYCHACGVTAARQQTAALRAARTALGLTKAEYVRRFGWGQKRAEAIARAVAWTR